MITIRPKKVAVVPLYDPDKTAGGIWIPDMAKERVDQGIVKYVGADVSLVDIGDHILFSGYTGSLVNLDGEGTLIIMEEDFITAKLCEPAQVEISSLYFRGVGGEYFPCTYEMAMEMIAAFVRRSDWFRRINVTTPRPTEKEYERMR